MCVCVCVCVFGGMEAGAVDGSERAESSSMAGPSNKDGLRVAVMLLYVSQASQSLLESARAAAKSRLGRGLLCTRTRKQQRGQQQQQSGGGSIAGKDGADAGSSGHDMTHLLDGVEEGGGGGGGGGTDGGGGGGGGSGGNTDTGGADVGIGSEMSQPIKSQAIEPAPVLLLDASDEIAWGLRDIPRGPVTWLAEPYVNVVMVAVGDMEDHRKLRPRLKLILDNEMDSAQPMLIVHVTPPCTEAAGRVQKRIYERFRDEAAVKRGVLCCRCAMKR